MPSGLAALLDDVAAIAKVAAASLDDVTAAAGKAGTKAAGVVIDDTAVTPQYVTGFTPDRELPMIWRIALGSLRNKLLLLLPAAIALSMFAPWAITPILMVGGAYLCFEGAEKLIEAMGGGHGKDADEDGAGDPAHLEEQKVSGAIRTDLILSAEIMAITLAEVADRSLGMQIGVLAAVGIIITLAVYGVVAFIVKMDDIGLHFARKDGALIQATGRMLVRGMPHLLTTLSVVGLAAMIWVGGGFIVHGLGEFGLHGVEELIHGAQHHAAAAMPFAEGVVSWTVGAIGAGIVGLIVGLIVALVVKRFH
ncbi:DUF808 domain-containing protein [Sphingomonas sp. C3-2]|uniref:DUF808 domain-containing protein n=1 Tax=Sphingomonas sp. C3-2 TaxID=3062169 RepID=UPI00294B79A4|nr:DUF808 domain-containing protein [Sphingomonas sp. C3-2]WOK36219.1 DUF808 domain-containing protein [Sphingomonas sp. C3-2]